MAGRLTLLTAPRYAPADQLTLEAWQVIENGFCCSVEDSRFVKAVRGWGFPVHVLGEAVADELRSLCRTYDPVVLLGPAPDSLVPDEVVVGGIDTPGAALLDVVAVVDRLRSPGGCPWDARQTHASLKPYLLEETYEALEALEDEDPLALREELGDVLFQVAFHSRLAEESEESWSIDDVAADLVAKLVRRHPHVFAATEVADAEEVSANWEVIKAAEKGRTSVTDGVPLGLPALMLAATLQRKASRLGVPPDLLSGSSSGEVGERLLALVAAARADGVDPEEALREAARALRDQVATVERSVRLDDRDPATLSEQEWRARWPTA